MQFKYMDQVTQTVEAKTENAAVAPRTGVETNVSAFAPADDPEAKLAAIIAENENLRRDRDNYRTVALAAKGKVDAEGVDLTDPVQLQAYIDKTLGEKLLATREAQSEKELFDFAKDLARKNKELATSIANRSQMVATGGSTGATGQEAKSPSYWSSEQAEGMKKRWKSMGIPDARIETMLRKAEENVRRTQ